jgi:glucan endo-1,3-beta-D-glucosidase
MQLTHALAFALSLSPAAAVTKGFNYGSTHGDGSFKSQQDYVNEFKTAKGLIGANDFNSARLYTMIQGGTTNTPITAIDAAIQEETTLLLGLWASGDTFDDEIAALKSAISTYGDKFAKLVVGISVGSEDLYRDSPTGIAAQAGIGKGPDTILEYIKTVRSTISGTSLKDAPVGHVDTWTAWANTTNQPVIDACDWLGIDAYPYFQNTDDNDVTNGKSLLQEAMNNVKKNSGDKPIWITETGWPVSGKTENKGVASIQNAKAYWDDVGCNFLFDKINTWWYILQDAEGTTPNPSFGLVGTSLTTKPLFDLTCPTVTSTTTSPHTSTTSKASGTSGADTNSGGASTFTTSPGTSTGTPTPGSNTPGATTPGATPTPTPGSSGTPGTGGASGTASSTSPVHTGAASSVSTSAAGIVAALFAFAVAF